MLVFLVACKPKEVVVSRELIGTETVQVSCNGPSGYCMSCGMDIFGNFSCMPAWKQSCPGTQAAKAELWSITLRAQNGTERTIRQHHNVRPFGECR